ncbi:MAG: hypothetical protein KYX63_00225 [Alteromonas macleodii]|nr:hypothetical protein [Alteromonas macleodii]
MEKHQNLNEQTFTKVAESLVTYFTYCLNEYSGYETPHIDYAAVGNERLLDMLQRLFRFGIIGQVIEGDLAPDDLGDIERFAKLESVIDVLTPNTICATLFHALSGRLKLCLYEGIPIEEIYDTTFYISNENALSVKELVALSNTSEGAVRNELSKMPASAFSNEATGKQLLKIEEAVEWLKSRKEYKPTKNLSGMTGLEKEYVNVPVASDGTYFSYACAYKRGGFTVGEKGDEIKVESFDEALGYLISMPHAKWRRPNAAGNYGIVSAIEWRRIPRSELNKELFEMF